MATVLDRAGGDDRKALGPWLVQAGTAASSWVWAEELTTQKLKRRRKGPEERCGHGGSKGKEGHGHLALHATALL